MGFILDLTLDVHLLCYLKTLLFCFLVQAAVAAKSMIVHELKESPPVPVVQVGSLLIFMR